VGKWKPDNKLSKDLKEIEVKCNGRNLICGMFWGSMGRRRSKGVAFLRSQTFSGVIICE
jgi:hypothetical protein